MDTNRLQRIALNVNATWKGLTDMERTCFKNVTHNIIREYKTVTLDGYSINAERLYDADYRLLLSYLLSIEEFEYATENPIRFDCYVDEYTQTIQQMLDDELGQVYSEDMEDRGMRRSYHNDNGEVFWTKRHGTYDE